MKKIISFIVMLTIIISTISFTLVADAAPAIPAKNADGSITHADGKVYWNDPNLVYTGRWMEEASNNYRSGWEGYVDVKFTGTTKLKALTSSGAAYIDILDESGKSILPVEKPELEEIGRNAYMSEGTDLTFGRVSLDASKIYTVRIISKWGNTSLRFSGIQMDAGAKTLPIADAPYIEFIGDSITEGYIDATYTNNGNSWTDSYAYRVGTLLGWHASAVARSGYAVADSSKTLMPTMYKRFAQEDPSTPLDYSRQSLDYIVINLGTNDGNAAKETFKAEYKKFVQYLLGVHPNAIIFVMSPFSDTAANYRFGNEIKAIADEFDRVKFISTADWNLTKTSTKASEYLTADKIHLKPAGADYAAQKLAEVLDYYHKNGLLPGEKKPTPTPTVAPVATPTVTPEENNPTAVPTATNTPSATNEPTGTTVPTVTEAPEDETPLEESKQNLTWLWITLGVAAAAAAVVVVILKKKKAATENQKNRLNNK